MIASPYKAPNEFDVYNAQLIIQPNKLFISIPFTVSNIKFVNKKSVTSEMSGIMKLMYCKNEFSKLDVRDHKDFDVFENGNFLFIKCL